MAEIASYSTPNASLGDTCRGLRIVEVIDAVSGKYRWQDYVAAADGVRFDYSSSPSTAWTINHNFGRYADVNVYTPGGVQILAEIVQVSINQVIIYFDPLESYYVVFVSR